ncbi:mitochondrial thiamine pyrophosphate transporter [Dissophora globulifera]|nr:mitochondrial thiamine pyrophosphate transporter [Dissophora globulifera]
MTVAATTDTPIAGQELPRADAGNAQRTSIATGTPTLSKTETVLCGAAAGVVSRFVIAPLDVVKIRLQMQTQRKDLSTLLKRGAAGTNASSATAANLQQKPKYRGMFSSMATIVREEGIRGLWKGNMAAEYLYLTYSGIQFLVYQQTKVFLNKTAEAAAQKSVIAVTKANPGDTGTVISIPGSVVATPLSAVSVLTKSSAVQSFIAGANAGVVATACTYPFDLLRTRFAVQQNVKIYTGLIQACRHIYRADGVRGFYRGMSPALIQIIPYMGIVFGSYDSLKRIASWMKTSATTSLPESGKKKRSIGQLLMGLEDLMCGGLAGLISKTSVYPLDMVRKRLQIQGSEQQRVTANIYSPSLGSKPMAAVVTDRLPNGVWRCAIHIARMEGYLALYKGLLPGLIKAAPSSAVTFLVFSQAGTVVEKFRGRHTDQNE